jgi:hypothetical protein
MIIVPKGKPAMENHNSYYLDMEKLLEYCHVKLGSGSIHFKHATAEGIIFFHENGLLNGIFSDKKGKELIGAEAIDRIIEASAADNFLLNVYSIDPDKVEFWANLDKAEPVHKNLTTELTDIEGMINKFSSNRFTGYFDITIGGEGESGLLFFNNGEFVEGSYSWKKDLDHSEESYDRLIQKAIESGGTFHVMMVSTSDKGQTDVHGGSASAVTALLEDLLSVFEKMVEDAQGKQPPFDTIFKRKLLEKADQYEFLDPFTGEFRYADQKIEFTGDADDRELARGIVETVKELADELGMLDQLESELLAWSERHSTQLEGLGVGF